MPRAASDAKGCTKGALVGGTAAISRLLREVLRLGLSDGTAVRIGRSHLADAVLAAAGHNFRRLFAWLTFLLLGILIALGLAAQLNRPEIGFFTADLI
jgi:hypothetical protein